MADSKITALTEETSPLPTDLAVMVDDPAGTPTTKKVTLENLGQATLGKIYAIGTLGNLLN